PAGERPELARVADEHRNIDGANALRDLARLDRTLGPRKEGVDDFLDGRGLAGGGVVGAPRLASPQQPPVRLDHVAHVGEVAPGCRRANLEDRGTRPPLDLRDLPGDVAPDEAEPLPG